MRIGGAGYRALGRGGWGDGCVREREREVCVGWEKGGRRGSSPVETEAGDVCVLDIRATPSRHGVWPCCCLIFCWWTSVLFENWTSFLAPMSREPQQLVNEETRAVCFSLRDKSRLALPCLAQAFETDCCLVASASVRPLVVSQWPTCWFTRLFAPGISAD